MIIGNGIIAPKIENNASPVYDTFYLLSDYGDLSQFSEIHQFPARSIVASSAFEYNSFFTGISLPMCTVIEEYGFQEASYLSYVNLPACTEIKSEAFKHCAGLATVSAPLCEIIRDNAFRSDLSLSSIFFPACYSIGTTAFAECTSLQSVSFPNLTDENNLAYDFITGESGSPGYLEYAEFGISQISASSFCGGVMISHLCLPSCHFISQVSLPATYFFRIKTATDCSFADYAFDLNNHFQLYLTGGNSNSIGTCTSSTFGDLNSLSLCQVGNSDSEYTGDVQTPSLYSVKDLTIYVPSSMVSSFKSASNWSWFQNSIFPTNNYM